MEQQGKIAKFNNEVYIVLLADNTKAVFKPKEEDEQDSAIGEVVAYHIARELSKTTGHLLVPPTISKTFEDRTGSLQWFVESNWDLWIDDQRENALNQVPPNIMSEAALFCHAFQWDTHPGNYMIKSPSLTEPGTYLALIDNEGIVNAKIVREYGQRHYVRICFLEDLITDLIFHTIEGESAKEDTITFTTNSAYRDFIQ